MTATVIEFPRRSIPTNSYAAGYVEGRADGRRESRETYFWTGVLAGCVVCALIVVAVHVLGII